MPANLPPQYFEAEKVYRSARTPEEKVEALEAMLAIMPRHKGTDHLRAELRTRIARHLLEAERKPSAHKGAAYSVRKEGAGQIALAGLPGSGKSKLVSTLTGVPLQVSDHLYTTRVPAPAMMEYENVQVQLVDMPSITDRDAGPWLSHVLRNADALMVAIDLCADPLGQMDSIMNELEQMKVRPIMAGVQDDPALTFIARRSTLVVGTKSDLDDGGSNYQRLNSEYGARLRVIGVSARTGAGLEDLRKLCFDVLDVIRVYTRPPGGKPDMTAPSVARRGSTVEQIAESVHKDFRHRLKYAQVWGSGRFEGQRVSRGHVLQDGDIIEFHV